MKRLGLNLLLAIPILTNCVGLSDVGLSNFVSQFQGIPVSQFLDPKPYKPNFNSRAVCENERDSSSVEACVSPLFPLCYTCPHPLMFNIPYRGPHERVRHSLPRGSGFRIVRKAFVIRVPGSRVRSRFYGYHAQLSFCTCIVFGTSAQSPDAIGISHPYPLVVLL